MTDDRVCVLGCTVRDVHFATCAWFGIEPALVPEVSTLPNAPEVCHGCAPAVARDGALICDRCYRRMGWLIRNAPDLVARLRGMADPTSAAPIERLRVSSGSASAPAPVSEDIVDASDRVMRTLRAWSVFVDRGAGTLGGMPAGAGPEAALDFADRCVSVIMSGFDDIANRRDEILALAEQVIVLHPAAADGTRETWSIGDAVARYRIEPESQDGYVEPTLDDGIISRNDIPEPRWNPLLRRPAAAKLAGSESTLQKWIAKGHLSAAAHVWEPRGGRVGYFYRMDVLAVKAMMADNAAVSRFRSATPTSA